MSKIISKTLILTGFLFMSALVFSKTENDLHNLNDELYERDLIEKRLSSDCDESNYQDYIYTRGRHYCFLVDADLSELDLSGANLYGADMQGANLNKTNLTEADVRFVNFEEADLSETIFTEANGMFSVFSHSNATEADFTDTDLDYSDWSFANVTDTIFDGAVLFDAIYDEKDLRYYGKTKGAWFD